MERAMGLFKDTGWTTRDGPVINIPAPVEED